VIILRVTVPLVSVPACERPGLSLMASIAPFQA